MWLVWPWHTQEVTVIGTAALVGEYGGLTQVLAMDMEKRGRFWTYLRE